MESEGLQCPALSHKLDEANRHERIPIEQWWQLLEDLAEKTDDPAVGLRVGRHAQPQDVGVLGYLAASCDTLGQALLRLNRFQLLLHDLSFTWVRQEGPNLYFGWAGDRGASTALSNEVLVSGLLTVMDTLTSPNRGRPVLIEFPDGQPGKRDLYERFFGCPVQFGCETLALRVPTALLGLPINSRDPQLRQVLDQQAEAMSRSLSGADEFLRQFQQAMMAGLEEGQLSMAWLSRKLRTPVRSLYRSLQQREKTYKGLLDELRLELAYQYLGDPALSLPEIALMLGYSEQSAFSRAFRKWTGQAPLRYRKGLDQR
ncbi:AraC family transcriptional regulator [Litoribrevibacter albus]|uniref:AraC family transcriptional regulator n=2 Tax=Litoribrevibacter albus TaxID=1473156 RepID=A0AA37SBM4_9GAMM|nr:AraC family transcriptional regulator [Litoribrevibacter albus]